MKIVASQRNANRENENWWYKKLVLDILDIIAALLFYALKNEAPKENEE